MLPIFIPGTVLKGRTRFRASTMRRETQEGGMKKEIRIKQRRTSMRQTRKKCR
jgi:CRISPR/Cas system CSM-associated protein Csm3 (group 7 of RAMP superfamily)